MEEISKQLALDSEDEVLVLNASDTFSSESESEWEEFGDLGEMITVRMVRTERVRRPRLRYTSRQGK